VGLDLLTLAFERPAIDWHAIAPELVLLTAGCLITLVDIVFLEKARPYTAALAGIGLLATAVPLLTLAVALFGAGFAGFCGGFQLLHGRMPTSALLF